MSILPPATQEAQTPTPTSVYLYYDNHDILIYVGITSRGMRRNREHNDTKDWWSFVVRQEVEHFNTRPDALAREKALIEKHSPPFNTHHNRDATKSRAAYLEFRIYHSAYVSLPDAIANLSEKRLWLEWHEGRSRNIVLRTRLEDAQIARALKLEEPVKAYGLPRKTAMVNKIEQVGPVALLHVTRESRFPLIDAYAAVKCDLRSPNHIARIRVVQMRFLHEGAKV